MDTTKDNSCSICLESFSDNDKEVTITKTCQHSFHKKCLKRHLRITSNCPLCRTELPKPPPRPLENVYNNRGECMFVDTSQMKEIQNALDSYDDDEVIPSDELSVLFTRFAPHNK